MHGNTIYREENREVLIAFMQQYPFATLCVSTNEHPVATQIPVMLKLDGADIILEGHIMRKSDHHLALLKNNNALFLFTGPHAHISASWYTTPAMASTWNFMTVHACGKIEFTDDAGTTDMIKRLTEKYEGTQASSSFDKMTDEYIQKNVKAIVGFTMKADTLTGVFKLSQNRDEKSLHTIIEQLKKRGDENSITVAAEMQKRIK